MGQVYLTFSTDTGRMSVVVQVDRTGKTPTEIEAEAREKVKALASVMLSVTMKATAALQLMDA